MLGFEYQNWVLRGTVAPVYVAGLDGVPVILVYEDPRVANRSRAVRARTALGRFAGRSLRRARRPPY